MQAILQEIGASVRRAAYRYERMFPRFEQRLRARLDLLVEFSTLGEYRVAAAGGVMPASSCWDGPQVAEAPRLRGSRCGDPGGSARHARCTPGVR